jgi:hypothetical protein
MRQAVVVPVRAARRQMPMTRAVPETQTRTMQALAQARARKVRAGTAPQQILSAVMPRGGGSLLLGPACPPTCQVVAEKRCAARRAAWSTGEWVGRHELLPRCVEPPAAPGKSANS